MAVKHAFTSAKSDGGDTTLVRPSNWNADHAVDVGGVVMASRTDGTDPTAPSADTLAFYAKTVAGRVMPKWIGPSGVDMIVQPHIGTNNIRLVTPGVGTAVGASPGTAYSLVSVGMPITSALISTGGGNSIPALASTNLLTQTKRAAFSTGTTINAGFSLYSTAHEVWRGNAAGLGGFFFVCRFGNSVNTTNGRFFVGLRDVTTAPTIVDYTAAATTTPGRIGVARTGTGNLYLVNCVSGTAPTATDLGANFAVNTAHLYELILFAKPNDSTVYYRVTNLSTGNSSSSSLTTNIPAATSFLSPVASIGSIAATSANTLDFVKLYLETDY
jgi:hypothetical protein